MSAFRSVAVPFVRIGNRRGLTDRQLFEDPALAEFVARFPTSFERDEALRVSLFVEPDMGARS